MSAKKPPADPPPVPQDDSATCGSAFQTAFEASLAVMYLLEPRTGIIQDANPAASLFYGLQRGELVGQPVESLSLLPRRTVKSLLAGIRKTGGGHFTSRHRLKSGEERDVEVHATLISRPGCRASIFVIVHDITARAQAEKSLRERESLLRAILDSASDGIGFKDREHVYREANPAFCRLLGLECKDVLGRTSADFFDRRKSALHVESDRRAMSERASMIYESRFETREGLRSICVHKAPVIDGQGDCLGVVFITHDNTEQRAAEARLRKSEGLLRAMLQSAEDSIYVTDAEGLLREVNQAFCALVGKPGEALLGQPLSAAFSAQELHIQQSTGQLAMSTQGPVNFTQRFQRAGRDIWVNVVKAPVIDEDGVCLGVVGMGRDITVQKVGELALRESERRYSVLVHQSPVGVFETDAKGLLTFANERLLRLTGRTLEQLSGVDWLASIHAEDRPGFVGGWNMALSGRREFSAEVRLRTARGVVLWVSFLMRPLRDAASRVIGYLGAVSDISERKKAEDLREDVEKIIRHDLKSPLAAMGNAAELIEMLGPLNAEQAQVLEELRALTARLLGLVGLSLDLRAMEDGRYVLEPEPVDVGEVLEALQAELRPLVEDKELTLRVELPEGGAPFFVQAERRLLDTVLANLLKNAAEASPVGGVVLVRLWREGAEAVISMRNRGAVPLEVRERFFEKYSTAGKRDGTGLGTYSARLMVRTLGGGIAVDTSEPEATTLTVRLPAEAAVGPAA